MVLALSQYYLIDEDVLHLYMCLDDYIDIINCNRDYNLLLKKYNIDYLLIEKYSPLYNNVLTNCNYKLIYHDEVSSIFEVKLK